MVRRTRLVLWFRSGDARVAVRRSRNDAEL
jgi:hypothetical protein